MIEKGKKQWVFVRKDLPDNIREKLKLVVDDIYQENLYEQLIKKYTKQ